MGRWPLHFLVFNEKEIERLSEKEKERVRDGHIQSSFSSLRNHPLTSTEDWPYQLQQQSCGTSLLILLTPPEPIFGWTP